MADASALLQNLNGGSTFVADLTGAGAQSTQLVVSASYTLQALSADCFVGFGSTSAAAQTDAATGAGEKLLADAPPRLFNVPSTSVQWVARTGDTATLRIRKAATP